MQHLHHDELAIKNDLEKSACLSYLAISKQSDLLRMQAQKSLHQDEESLGHEGFHFLIYESVQIIDIGYKSKHRNQNIAHMVMKKQQIKILIKHIFILITIPNQSQIIFIQQNQKVQEGNLYFLYINFHLVIKMDNQKSPFIHAMLKCQRGSNYEDLIYFNGAHERVSYLKDVPLKFIDDYYNCDIVNIPREMKLSFELLEEKIDIVKQTPYSSFSNNGSHNSKELIKQLGLQYLTSTKFDKKNLIS
ncbi:unnamed protein product [Paramecium primaurelia]|uniref:Uncharacterized protein n=1 Tax=Paramecium primaurelia TaxID=5886 RepID=A0A8S1JZS8_PARPR|nr:unnamed protein product [Paramecium primaurelia]